MEGYADSNFNLATNEIAVAVIKNKQFQSG